MLVCKINVKIMKYMTVCLEPGRIGQSAKLLSESSTGVQIPSTVSKLYQGGSNSLDTTLIRWAARLCGCKSHPWYQIYGCVAQIVEHLSEEQGVVGAVPTAATINTYRFIV